MDIRDTIKRASENLKVLNKAIKEHTHAFHVNREDFQERVEWCQANMTGSWFPIDLAGMCSIRIQDEKDAMLYKLTWK